jgi:hypothetical protein
MLWLGDHYVRVDCLDSTNKLIPLKPIPYDPVEFNRKKLQVCDTTTFFRFGKPVVWYSKKDNVVEFFNMDGVHPVSDCELKKITQHMIDEYVPPCK